jgi:sugar lactone lactonase YvrE
MRLRSGLVALALGTAIAGSGTSAQQEGLVYPVDLVASDGGGWVVADFKAHGLLSLANDGAVTPLRIGEGLPRTPLYGTRAVLASPDGNGYLVADPGTFGLYRVAADGQLSTITTELDIPQGLARFDDDSVLVADLRSGFGVLLRVTLDGEVTEFADIDSPKGIAVDGEDFVVVSHGARAIFRVARSGRVSTLAAGPPLDFPHDIVSDGSGGFVVTDGYASAVFRVSASGEIGVLAQGDPLVNPQGIVRSEDGSYVVVDPQAGAVFRITPSGEVSRIASAHDSQ